MDGRRLAVATHPARHRQVCRHVSVLHCEVEQQLMQVDRRLINRTLLAVVAAAYADDLPKLEVAMVTHLDTVYGEFAYAAATIAQAIPGAEVEINL